VGGLVCRLPLEVEIYRSQETIGKVLRNSLGLDDDDDDDDTNNADRDGIRTGGRPSSSAFYDEDWIEEGGSGSAAGTNTNNNNIPQEEEIVDDPSTLSRQIYNGVSPNSAKTVLWYRGASALVKEELKKITDSAENGQIDAGLLQPQSQELLQLYLDNQVRTYLYGVHVGVCVCVPCCNVLCFFPTFNKVSFNSIALIRKSDLVLVWFGLGRKRGKKWV
jgi:hypothetical protein